MSKTFILYRTRMAAQATAENPALSNPQISKILGDRWAKETDEVKAQWKRLAEEESKRHRQQYPDYRFQPKRRGSKASQASRLNDDDSERCPRQRSDSIPDSSALLPPHQQQPGRGIVRTASELDDLDMASPELKRRRLTTVAEGHPGIHPIQTWASAHDPRHHQHQHHNHPQGYSPAARTPTSAGFDAQSRGGYPPMGTALPGPGVVARQPSVPRPPHRAPPPPRPAGVSGPWTAASAGYAPYRRSPPAESVRLPPLKTAITPTAASSTTGAPSATTSHDPDSALGYPPITAGLGITGGRGSPERSAAEQIMALPFARKMAVVSKICPPLPRTGGPGASGKRGAVIAVEGSRSDILHQVSQAVEKTLAGCQRANLRAWANESPFDGGAISSAAGELQDRMPSIFEDILSWHKKSKEVARHVLEPAAAGGRASPGDGDEVSPTTTTTAARLPAPSVATPVALLKDGFSLSMSDRFACATSRSLSNYGPVDHWQWMATLWRGIVGPDLIVHAVAYPDDDMEKLKTVEFQKHLGVMAVRVAATATTLDEATERRLNFEILEWVNEVWPKETGR
ncbi:hypothetical protein GMORB2_0145 [Geosmithia morbida]|uniref:HMG box domain-containing protein n=1 Tax=Geosmithia morbida TaxID=1094350 RepID=A0A9P5D9D5_9HYPO|nr:uncharacterized protein GMORB2_0145 [Geosmithia morbida]KAF4126409.1 hypothetical protein GMORB2_0145 [Geosmithia morbida]